MPPKYAVCDPRSPPAAAHVAPTVSRAAAPMTAKVGVLRRPPEGGGTDPSDWALYASSVSLRPITFAMLVKPSSCSAPECSQSTLARLRSYDLTATIEVTTVAVTKNRRLVKPAFAVADRPFTSWQIK